MKNIVRPLCCGPTASQSGLHADSWNSLSYYYGYRGGKGEAIAIQNGPLSWNKTRSRADPEIWIQRPGSCAATPSANRLFPGLPVPLAVGLPCGGCWDQRCSVGRL